MAVDRMENTKPSGRGAEPARERWSDEHDDAGQRGWESSLGLDGDARASVAMMALRLDEKNPTVVLRWTTEGKRFHGSHPNE